MNKLEIHRKPEGEYLIGKELGELHVNMSNVLIRAAHGLNLVEKRIISACVAQIDNMRIAQHDNYNQMVVKLDASTYGTHYGIGRNNAYMELRTAAERLFERYITIQRETPKGLKEHKFRWVSGVTYHHGEGFVELNFTREVMPYISLLRRDYTSYKLKLASALRSVYSWRLLELFKSWQSTKELYITLEDFRHALEIPKNYTYTNIKQRCIEPAVKELQDKNGFIITWKPIKKGRSVASLRFKWKENDQIELDLKGGKPTRKRRTNAADK